MSEPVSALNQARNRAGIAEISEIGPLGMITLRGALNKAYLRDAAKAAAGVAFPDTRMCVSEGDSGIAWMSPDEVLVMCPYAEVKDRLAKITTGLKGQHALAVNVSDARAVFQLKGRNAREVMAKLAPVDLGPDAFTPGMFRRTRMAQVPAAFWMRDAETFQIICFRSVAQYMFVLLSVVAQPGSEVGHFSA